MLEKIISSIFAKLGFEIVKKLFSSQDPTLNSKMREAINNAIEKFKDKYSNNNYGDVNNNFLASQENFDKFLKSIDYDTPGLTVGDINPSGFDETSSAPKKVIEDFISLVNQEIKKYPELHILKTEKAILEEIKEIKNLLKKELPNPKFVDHQAYFKQHERHLIQVSAVQIERFKKYVEKIQSFSCSEENIFLLCGKGGNGKSHILRELSAVIQNPYKLVFVQPNIRDFSDAFQDELSSEEKYLFIFDDADRYIEEIPTVISLIKSRQRDFKLLLTCRPSGKNLIEKIIYDSRLEDFTIKIDLPEWKIPELVQLLDEMGVSLHKDEKILIAKKYPNPYLITWIGRQYKGETTISIEKIREKFIGDIKREVEHELKSALQNPLDFLIDLAIIVPFDLNDQNLIKTLSKRYSISGDNITDVFNLLIEAGILRRIGRTIRFDPDMRGDLLLFYYLENNEDLSFKLLEFWLPVFPEKVFINIQSLSRYFASSAIKDFCSVEINKWIDEAENTDDWERINNLKLLSYIAHLIPEQSINLLNVYLSSSAPPKENRLYNFEASTDDYGPVLTSLMWLPNWHEHILEIIEALASKKIGTYDNYKPKRLIQSLVSPLNHKPEHIIKVLEKIEPWFSKPNEIQSELIENALVEILSSAHEVIEGYGYMIKILELPLKLTEGIVNMRKKAVQLLIKLINSEEESLILLAVIISRQIGESKMRRISVEGIPLKEEITEERKLVVQSLGELIKNNPPLKVLQEVEDLFLHWFAAETLGTEGVESFLISFPRTTEYLVFKSFVEPHFLVADFQEIINNAPKGNRWDRMFENYYHKNFHHNNDKLYYELALKLNSKYQSAESTFAYLKNLDNIISPLSPWNHPLIVTEWIKISRDKFLQIKENNEYWKNLPHRFKNEIEIELSKKDEEYIEKLADEIFSNETDLNRVRTFLSILQTKKGSVDKLGSWISKLAATNDISVLEELAYCLWNIFNKYELYEKLTEICVTLISPYEAKKRNIFSRLDFSFDLIRKNRKKIGQPIHDKLASISEEYLKSLSDVSYQHESILFLTFKDRVPAFIKFLIYRYEEEKKDYSNYRSVPAGGFRKLKYLIDSKEKFDLLVKGIEKINEEISFGGLRLRDLNNNSISLYNEESKKQFYVEYIEELINNDLLRAIKFLPFIDDKEKQIQLIFNVADKGILNGHKENVIDAYHSLFENTSFSWGTEEFERSKSFFVKLKGISKPGLHAKIIQDHIDYLDKQIKGMNRDDEEFYIPRG